MTAQKFVQHLNEVLELDRATLETLLSFRVPCNAQLAKSSLVQTSVLDGKFQVNFLGILNAFLVREAMGVIAVYDMSTGRLLRFDYGTPG